MLLARLSPSRYPTHSPFSAFISALSVGQETEPPQRRDEPHPRPDRKLPRSSSHCPAPFLTADTQNSGVRPNPCTPPPRASPLHSGGLGGHPTARPAGEGSGLERPRTFLPPETRASCSWSRRNAWSCPLHGTDRHGELLQHPHGDLTLLWDSPRLEKGNRRKMKKPFTKRLMHCVFKTRNVISFVKAARQDCSWCQANKINNRLRRPWEQRGSARFWMGCCAPDR